MTRHDETLLLELLSNIPRAASRHFNPCLTKDCAGDDDVDNVDCSVNGIKESLLEAERRRHVVSDALDCVQLLAATLSRLPDTDQANQKVLGEALEQHLRKEEDVRGQGGLQHDGHVAGVEEPDWERAAHATLAARLDGDLDAETLEVDDSSENDDSR